MVKLNTPINLDYINLSNIENTKLKDYLSSNKISIKRLSEREYNYLRPENYKEPLPWLNDEDNKQCIINNTIIFQNIFFKKIFEKAPYYSLINTYKESFKIFVNKLLPLFESHIIEYSMYIDNNDYDDTLNISLLNIVNTITKLHPLLTNYIYNSTFDYKNNLKVYSLSLKNNSYLSSLPHYTVSLVYNVPMYINNKEEYLKFIIPIHIYPDLNRIIILDMSLKEVSKFSLSMKDNILNIFDIHDTNNVLDFCNDLILNSINDTIIQKVLYYEIGNRFISPNFKNDNSDITSYIDKELYISNLLENKFFVIDNKESSFIYQYNKIDVDNDKNNIRLLSECILCDTEISEKFKEICKNPNKNYEYAYYNKITNNINDYIEKNIQLKEYLDSLYQEFYFRKYDTFISELFSDLFKDYMNSNILTFSVKPIIKITVNKNKFNSINFRIEYILDIKFNLIDINNFLNVNVFFKVKNYCIDIDEQDLIRKCIDDIKDFKLVDLCYIYYFIYNILQANSSIINMDKINEEVSKIKNPTLDINNTATGLFQFNKDALNIINVFEANKKEEYDNFNKFLKDIIEECNKKLDVYLKDTFYKELYEYINTDKELQAINMDLIEIIKYNIDKQKKISMFYKEHFDKIGIDIRSNATNPIDLIKELDYYFNIDYKCFYERELTKD